MWQDDYSGKWAVVLGGAGFLGSHLCDRLLELGAFVFSVDDYSTGQRSNLQPRVAAIRHNIVHPFPFNKPDWPGLPDRIDFVFNLASPASPADFASLPTHILRTGSDGTRHAVDLAAAHAARLVQASTSEVYGDPLVHPQPETYWGNVNPVGPRAVYDEAKRYAEALISSRQRDGRVNAGIARIFNTYGPRMRVDDGRVIPSFFAAAMAGQPLPVRGDGLQTRSLAYVSDTVNGLLALGASDVQDPVNIGNPDEISVLALAWLVQEAAGNSVGVTFLPGLPDDPARRCPDISRARDLLGWEPVVSLEEGLAATFRHLVGSSLSSVADSTT